MASSTTAVASPHLSPSKPTALTAPITHSPAVTHQEHPRIFADAISPHVSHGPDCSSITWYAGDVSGSVSEAKLLAQDALTTEAALAMGGAPLESDVMQRVPLSALAPAGPLTPAIPPPSQPAVPPLLSSPQKPSTGVLFNSAPAAHSVAVAAVERPVVDDSVFWS
jgi:hypothetical protein